MSTVRVRLDKSELMNAVSGPVMVALEREANRRAKKAVSRANADLFEQFLENEISAEIAAGPEASNTSGLLGGYGNLFTFLGFDEGSHPVQELARFLAKSIEITTIVKDKRRLAVTVIISIPTIEDFDFAELPWATESWIMAIEKGISGLGKYLYSDYEFSASRSEFGIQAKTEIRGGQLNGTPYLSAIIQKVAKKLISEIRKGSGGV